MSEHTFESFPKIARLSRDIVITEKIDGTNASIYIDALDGTFLTGSRTRWITPQNDNAGFSQWAHNHKTELINGLGHGLHYGEWWGAGIQRRYGMKEKHFSLFNTSRWSDPLVRPACCDVVPVLYEGPFNTQVVDNLLDVLAVKGSRAAPGFMDPEGVVIFHTAGNLCFKKTLKDDGIPKSILQKEGK
jgi:hypothetical protein